MDLQSPTNVVACGKGLGVSTVSRFKVAKQVGKAAGKSAGKQTGNATGKPGSKATGSRHSIGSSARLKTGAGATKKRNKLSSAVSAGPAHPSVIMAGSWTARQEQMEEVRARRAVYSTPRTECVCLGIAEACTVKPSKRLIKSRTVVASSTPSTLRPWEWSAQDCKAVLVGALLPNPAGRPSGKEGLNKLAEGDSDTSDSEEKLNGSVRWLSPIEVVLESAEENTMRKKKPPDPTDNPSRRIYRNAASFSCDAGAGTSSPEKIPNLAVRCGETSERKLETSTGPESSVVLDPSQHETIPNGPVRRGKKPGRKPKSHLRSASSICSTSVGFNSSEDEQRARDISAALNRNYRRLCRSGSFCGKDTDGRIGDGKVLSNRMSRETAGYEPETSYTRLKLGRDKLMRHPNKFSKVTPAKETEEEHGNHTHRTWSGARNNKVVSSTGRAISPVMIDTTSDNENKADTHPWTSKGLDFGEGTKAEVWWDDGKWYRCSIFSVSARGRYGVLEFFPTRQTTRPREYSTELDLGLWIREGHLVQPGSHLKWP